MLMRTGARARSAAECGWGCDIVTTLLRRGRQRPFDRPAGSHALSRSALSQTAWEGPDTESLVPLSARDYRRWSWMLGEVRRPCRLRAANTSLDTCQQNPCTPVTPLPRRHRPRYCPARVELSRLALMPSTGVTRGWPDAPAAAPPSQQSSPSCLRAQAGRIQPTCCCAGITTAQPGTHLISRAPRSLTLTAGASRATYGRMLRQRALPSRPARTRSQSLRLRRRPMQGCWASGRSPR